MLILLTNDDGIFSPGLAAIRRELETLGELYVVAPAAEQSGVSQSLTFRTPLIVKDVFINDERWGWGVEGSPADCVKVGVNAICPRKPDIVVSGINWGQNCGTNILYSGTLGAAFDGGVFGIPSFALSVEDTPHPQFARAAAIAKNLIVQILEKIAENPSGFDACGNPVADVYNINMSTESLEVENPPIFIAPMDTTPYGTQLESRTDTFGRRYYWFVPNPRPRRPECLTDMNLLRQNQIVVTPLHLDRTNHARCDQMRGWNLQADTSDHSEKTKISVPDLPQWSMRTQRSENKS